MPNPTPALALAALPFDAVEPSDSERAEWPDATREYVAELERHVDTLTAALSQGAADAARLDHLDTLREEMVDSYTGPDGEPEPELVGYMWRIAGQCETVRAAIDKARAALDTARAGEASHG